MTDSTWVLVYVDLLAFAVAVLATVRWVLRRKR